MSAPSRRIFAIAKALRLGSVQNLLNAPRSREAVSAFFIQIGFRTASTSSVAMVSTGFLRRGAAYVSKVGFPLGFVLFVSEPADSASLHVVSHLAERGNAAVALAFLNGISPLRDLAACVAAFSRASARGTLIALPKPISLALPRQVKRRTHLRAPLSVTIKYRLPPSLYFPAFADATFRAVSFPSHGRPFPCQSPSGPQK